MNGYERKVVENVREFGCHITFVFDDEQDGPDFAYSVGFDETVQQPEVIMFGLPQKVMKFSINETLQSCRDGLELEDWTQIEGILEGHRCIARTVHPSRVSRKYFNSAIWYQGAKADLETIRAVQLVWPGSLDGLFPWDEGCAAVVRDLQPALYEPRFDT